MSTTLHKQLERRYIRPCTLVWAVLMALTLAAFGVGKLGLSGGAVTGFILVGTLIKGQMVADFFMGLRRVRPLWRLLLAGWLLFVIGGIGFAYRLSLG